MPFPQDPRVLPMKLLRSPDAFRSLPLCVCPSGEGTLGGCGACPCAGDTPTGDTLKTRAQEGIPSNSKSDQTTCWEVAMSELWIFYDFKDEKVQTRWRLVLPRCSRKFSETRDFLSSFSVHKGESAVGFALCFLFAVFISIVCFLFRPCQHISRALPDCLIHNWCNPHHLCLRLLEKSKN